jgi:hypothetical protein
LIPHQRCSANSLAQPAQHRSDETIEGRKIMNRSGQTDVSTSAGKPAGRPKSLWRRPTIAAGLLTFSVLAGLAAAAVQQYWLGQLPGDYSSTAAAIGLLTLAVAAPITGLGALLGRGGVVLGVVLVFLVGNALSAVATAPQLLPQPWGAAGHYLPIGSGATLLRSVAYFRGSGATPEAAVLIAYAIGGLVLVAARRRGPSRHRTPAAELKHEAAPVA